MIFYFSGTGNSQLTAKQIAEVTGDELISINLQLRSKKKRTFRSQRALVFVVPTYAWRMPRVVEQWIRCTKFEGSRDAYFVLTCGGGCGHAAAYAKKLCRAQNFNYRGLAPVLMPENYTAMFATPEEEECRSIIEAAKPRIAELAGRIQGGEPFPEPRVSLGDRLLSGPVNALFYPFAVHDRGFTVSDGCISCGKCARSCPLINIGMVDGKPVWKGNCTHCMACINGCPSEAIEYKAKSKGRHRHYLMEE